MWIVGRIPHAVKVGKPTLLGDVTTKETQVMAYHDTHTHQLKLHRHYVAMFFKMESHNIINIYVQYYSEVTCKKTIFLILSLSQNLPYQRNQKILLKIASKSLARLTSFKMNESIHLTANNLSQRIHNKWFAFISHVLFLAWLFI